MSKAEFGLTLKYFLLDISNGSKISISNPPSGIKKALLPKYFSPLIPTIFHNSNGNILQKESNRAGYWDTKKIS